MCNFIWREELQLAIHSSKRSGFFLRMSLIYLFFHEGCFFDEAVAAIHFLWDYMEQTIFDSSYLLRKPTFLEDVAQNFNHIRQVYLFHNLKLQPSTLWQRVSAFVTKRMTVIHSLKGIVFILTGELATLLFE